MWTRPWAAYRSHTLSQRALGYSTPLMPRLVSVALGQWRHSAGFHTRPNNSLAPLGSRRHHRCHRTDRAITHSRGMSLASDSGLSAWPGAMRRPVPHSFWMLCNRCRQCSAAPVPAATAILGWARSDPTGRERVSPWWACALLSSGLACGRCSSPVNAVQHDLLKPWGLKTPCIMSEQQHKDIALTVFPRPSQRKCAARHRLWTPFRPPGIRAIRRCSGNKDVVTISEREAHVQFIGGLEVSDTTYSRMSWSTHVNHKCTIGWMETRARYPPPASNLVICLPALGQTRGDVETNKALA